MERVVVFDLGRVFFDWSPHYLYDELLGSAALTEQMLQETQLLTHNLAWDQGRPILPDLVSLGERFPKWRLALLAWSSHWSVMLKGLYEPTMDVHKALVEKGVKTYGLTNWSSETLPYAKALAPEIFERFEGLLVSAEEGMIKPETAIYHRFEQRFGLKSEQIVFIDDNTANVSAARALGWTAIWLVNPDELKEQLRAVGISLP